MLYDAILFFAVSVLFLWFQHIAKVPDNSVLKFTWPQLLAHAGLATIVVILLRFLWKVYNQIWRYGGVQSYIAVMLADGCATFTYYTIQYFLPNQAFPSISFTKDIACFIPINTIIALAVRMAYRFIYKRMNRNTKLGRFVTRCANIFGKCDWTENPSEPTNQIRIAILGAGKVGTGLAEELTNNITSSYKPVCFIDNDKDKLGREIYGIPVYSDIEATPDFLKEHQIQEVVFALPPTVDSEERRALYDKFKLAGFKVKVYDYPTMHVSNKGRRTMREFDVDELLFRKEQEVITESTINYYKDKVVLVTGGVDHIPELE